MDFAEFFLQFFCFFVLGDASDSVGNAFGGFRRVVRDHLLCILCLAFRGFYLSFLK